MLVFFWTYDWLGFRAAVCALAFYTLIPDVSAHAALVTTDLGVTVFVFAAAFFLWRVSRKLHWRTVAALSLSVAAAVLTKFSALVLGPIVIGLLALAVWRRTGLSTRQAALVVGAIAVTTWMGIWTAYGWRDAPSHTPNWRFDVAADAASHPSTPLAGLAAWIDTHHILPNAFTQGALSCANGSAQRAYLLGRVSDRGWWYYFPVAFVVKAPVSFLLLLAIGAVVCVVDRRRLGLVNEAFLLVPVGVYLAAAMASGVNIGVRHILPIEPFLAILAGIAADRVLAMPRWAGRVAVGGVVLGWVISFASAYPHTLGFFNVLAGGPRHGLRYLADSNLDWGQHLKLLKQWMDEHQVSHINLAYFGQADPAYYKIDCTYLPATFAFASRVQPAPTLPGYVAISATVLSGVYLDPEWRVFYSGFRRLPPTAEIGHSIRVYWIEHWPDADDTALHPEVGDGPDAEAALAKRLLFNLRWPRLAAVHYRHYLRHRPNDPAAFADYGTALQVAGDTPGGVDALQRAVTLAPTDASMHVSLGKALLSAGRLADAEREATTALAIKADDPPALDLRGRVYGLQGRLAEAAAEFERALRCDPSYGPAAADLDRVRQMMRQRDPSLATSSRTRGTLR